MQVKFMKNNLVWMKQLWKWNLSMSVSRGSKSRNDWQIFKQNQSQSGGKPSLTSVSVWRTSYSLSFFLINFSCPFYLGWICNRIEIWDSCWCSFSVQYHMQFLLSQMKKEVKSWTALNLCGHKIFHFEI